MEKITINNYKVVHMNAKSLTFEIDGKVYFATKRVANEILSGEAKEVFVINKNNECGAFADWLATPSIF